MAVYNILNRDFFKFIFLSLNYDKYQQFVKKTNFGLEEYYWKQDQICPGRPWNKTVITWNKINTKERKATLIQKGNSGCLIERRLKLRKYLLRKRKFVFFRKRVNFRQLRSLEWAINGKRKIRIEVGTYRSKRLIRYFNPKKWRGIDVRYSSGAKWLKNRKSNAKN